MGTITVIEPSAPQQPTAITGPSGYMAKSNNLSDVANVAAARTNLGLSSSSSIDTTNANNITSGTLVAGRLPAFAAGDVTSSAGSAVLSIVNGHVTAAKMASGAAVGNIGFTPANKAGDTFSGPLYAPGFVYYANVATGNSSFAAANDAVIAGALSAVAAAGGGVIKLPNGDIYISAPIDNKYPRVIVEGVGDDYQHNAGSNPTYGTRIVPTFAGTALKHRTPYSATTTKFFGGGFRHLTVIGNSIATRLLEVDSIAGGTYDLYLEDSVGAEAAYFKSGVTVTDLAEDAGIQLAHINLRIRQLDSVAAAAADGVVFDGSTNANFSYNPWVVLDVTHKNGTAAKFKNADNNTITFRSFRASGGTGKAIRMYGAQVSGVVGGTLNRFMRLQAAVADGSTTDLIYSEGTDTGGVSAGVQNDIQALDTGNGTPDPTHGTGSLWRWTNNLTLATHGGGAVDITAGQVFSSGGTTVADNVAFSSYTPTVTSGSGTITTLGTITGKYKQLGKLVTVSVAAAITTLGGTAATSIIISLPVTAASNIGFVGQGREAGVSGKMLQAFIGVGASTMVVKNYDDTFPGASGANMTVTATYEVP